MNWKKLILFLGAVIFPLACGAAFFVTDTSQTTNLTDPIATDNFALKSDGDLYLASGNNINWNSDDIVLTHSDGNLTLDDGILNFKDSTNIYGSAFRFYQSYSSAYGFMAHNYSGDMSLSADAGNTCGANSHIIFFINGNERMKLYNDGDLYVYDNVSAASFTDRTPAFSGNAIAAIMNIKDDGQGNIDHNTLPVFARKDLIIETKAPEINASTTEEIPAETKIEAGRDLGAMVSILTKAIQEQQNEIQALKLKLETNVNLP